MAFRPYETSRLVTGMTGTILAFIALKPLIKNFNALQKNNASVGNEPYLAAIILSMAISIFLLIWGIKTLFKNITDIIQYQVPEPIEFEDYSQLEHALVGKKIPPHEKASVSIIKKDKSFILIYIVFLGVILIGFFIKLILPNVLFWNHNLAPEDFSFPLLFIFILSVTAFLRGASIYIHSHIYSPIDEVSETIISVHGKEHPYTFLNSLEKAMASMQKNDKPNYVSNTPIDGTDIIKTTGKIQRKLFIETTPQHVPYEPQPITFVYLLLATLWISSGCFLLTRLPPDNISVPTVPIIAIDYICTLIKGGILVITGTGLLKSVFPRFKNFQFKSIVVYVEINGTYEKVPDGNEITGSLTQNYANLNFHSDCKFKIFTTTLLTEISAAKKKRDIIGMTVEEHSEEARKMVSNTIESFSSTIGYISAG